MNYEEMEDKELDKLSAEKFGTMRPLEKLIKAIEVVEIGGKEFPLDHFEAHYTWRPCHPDSNQAERYLFPKLWDQKIQISINFGDAGDYFSVSVKMNHEMTNKVFDIIQLPKGIDKINRTKVIACLKAMDELNKGNKNAPTKK